MSNLKASTAIPKLFTLVSSATIPLTRELAAEFAGMAPSPTERDLSSSRLRELREKIDGGLAVPFNWATAELDGKQYRINGQHSSRLLNEANGSFPEGVTVHRDHYKCDNDDGLIMLFRQHDPRGSGRSPADVAGTYQGFEDDLHEVPKDLAKMAIEGIAWFLKEIEGNAPRKGDDRYTLFHDSDYHDFLLWVAGIFSVKTPEMRRQTVLSAMWGTVDLAEQDARDFWDEVARGGNPSNDDAPSSKLDAWLKAIKAKDEKQVPHRLKAGAIYQGCIYAWNAFRRGDDLPKGIKADLSKGYLEISE
jgi:hypothetical protein